MAVPPIVDPAVLTAWLGGVPNPDVVALCAAAADEAVRAVVDPPPADAPPEWVWPSGVSLAGLGVAGDTYKALSAPGGGYALDDVVFTDAFKLTSALLRKYEPLINPERAVGGMVG